MHHLILVRHSKAEPGSEVADFERELTPTGRKMATNLGKQLLELGIKIDFCISSKAIRAKQTAQIILKTLGETEETAKSKTKLSESLYFADPSEVIDKIKKVAPKTAKTVIVVAHEPSISSAAAILANAKSNVSALRFVKLGMSTAMAAILETNCSFSELKPACAKLHPLVRGEK